MTTKLQKIERTKQLPSRGRPEGTIPQPVTQTIIINNPNININYLNQASKPNGPLSSRGLDSWNLNNNLKEFSETRQLGFFRQRKDRNKSNSPYIIHKVRTQDLRSANKMYVPSQANPLKDTLSSFRKNETIAHMPQPSIPDPIPTSTQTHNTLQKLIAKHDKTVTQKFYQGRMKKQVAKDYETLPTNFINATNPYVSAPKSFRKDRFEIIQPTVSSLTGRKPETRESKESADSPQKTTKVEEKEERLSGSDQSERKVHRQIAPRILPLELRRKAFTKTIAKIDQALLNNTDDYFERFHTYKLPQTQIELLVNSVSPPEQTVVESRVRAESGSGWGVYEFEFQEQRKRRPKTPKRKKQYQEDGQ